LLRFTGTTRQLRTITDVPMGGRFGDDLPDTPTTDGSGGCFTAPALRYLAAAAEKNCRNAALLPGDPDTLNAYYLVVFSYARNDWTGR